MFFNPDATYDKAICDRDVEALKALLVGIIGSDPTFVTSEFEEAQEYIRNKSMEVNGEEIILEEDYQKQEDEYEKSEWDEQYFQLNLVWMRDNFALAERLPNIKKIGKYVYKDKQTYGKAKVKNRQYPTPPSSHNNGSRERQQKKSAARTARDGHKEKQLPGGFSEWTQNNRRWMLLVAIIIVLALFFIIRGRAGKNDDISDRNASTKDSFDEAFCFALD